MSCICWRPNSDLGHFRILLTISGESRIGLNPSLDAAMYNTLFSRATPGIPACNALMEYTIRIIFFLLDNLEKYRTLSTSYDCEPDNPNLALFKYDQNKPQRLSFLGDVNKTTGEREELCIRNFLVSTIQVEPTCTDDLLYPNGEVSETYFQELF